METQKMKQSKSYQNLQSAKALFGNISDRRAANLQKKMLLQLKAGFEQEQANIEGTDVKGNTSRASSASTTKRNAMNAR